MPVIACPSEIESGPAPHSGEPSSEASFCAVSAPALTFEMMTVPLPDSCSPARKPENTLAEGHSLPFFAAIEEEEAQEEAVQQKVEKAATKQAEKEAKPRRHGLRRAQKDQEAK